MFSPKRFLSTVGGRRIVVALGGLYVVIATGRALVRIADGTPVSAELIIFSLLAGPGLGLFYGGYRLPRSDVHPEFHASIAGWCLGGLGVMIGILVLYDLQPDGGITHPVQNGLILTALASFAGFGAGIHDARAKTRTHELEETIEKLQTSNERLEQFAFAASHDLQEPLRMVSTYLRLLESRYADDLDEDGREFLEFAVDGADRMRAMIDGLLAYSRVETEGGPLEPVELDAVLEDVLDDLQVRIEECDAEITVEPLPRVEGDASQLRQLFQNLLDNAIEYAGDAPPRVHVTAERSVTRIASARSRAERSRPKGLGFRDDERRQSRLSNHPRVDGTAAETDGGWRAISVRDEGIGIDPDDQDRVFEVFERLHTHEEHAGTGIGLALSARIVERHGGDIRVDSEPGEGTTFSFTLPAADDHEQ